MRWKHRHDQVTEGDDDPRGGFPGSGPSQGESWAYGLPGGAASVHDSPYGEPPGYGPRLDELPGYGPPHDDPPEEESSLVRLYTVTGGRTAPRTHLAMEALVSSATSVQLGLSYIREYRAISDLCRQIRSVAEISALLGIPLGVARVLITDMESEGLVRVHQHRIEERGPDLGLLERVLSGLHRL